MLRTMENRLLAHSDDMSLFPLLRAPVSLTGVGHLRDQRLVKIAEYTRVQADNQ